MATTLIIQIAGVIPPFRLVVGMRAEILWECERSWLQGALEPNDILSTCLIATCRRDHACAETRRPGLETACQEETGNHKNKEPG